MYVCEGFATPVLGYSNIFEPAGEAHYIVGFQSGSDWFMVYPADVDSDGVAETLQAYDGTTETEITWTTGDYTAGYKWTGGIMNGVAILNNYGDCPQYWGGTGDAQALIWSSTNTWDDFDGADGVYRAKVIRSYRNFLFALGLSEDGTEYLTQSTGLTRLIQVLSQSRGTIAIQRRSAAGWTSPIRLGTLSTGWRCVTSS